MVWSGSPTHERDHERSIALDVLAPLWHKADAQFYAPFKGAAPSLDGNKTPLIPPDHLFTDFPHTPPALPPPSCLATVSNAAATPAGPPDFCSANVVLANPDFYICKSLGYACYRTFSLSFMHCYTF